MHDSFPSIIPTSIHSINHSFNCREKKLEAEGKAFHGLQYLGKIMTFGIEFAEWTEKFGKGVCGSSI